MTPNNHHLLTVALKDVRPTQITVGYAEVQAKRAAWQLLAAEERKPFLLSHYLPAVRGPKSQIYIVDHHHLGLALMEERVEHTHVMLLRDLSSLKRDEFWAVMDHHQWVHAYDERGRRCDMDALPKRLTHLRDDPYRSLAGEARRAGAFAKDRAPFAEFLWADFFRRRIPIKAVQTNSETTLQRAVELARSPAAEHLPGWAGTSS